MSVKTAAGLQNSGTTDESSPENVEATLDLAERSKLHGRTIWSGILGISAAKTSTWIAELSKALEIVSEGLLQLRIVLYSAVAPSEMPVSASSMVANSNCEDTNEDDSNSEPDNGLDTVVNTSSGLAVDTDNDATEA